MIHGWMENCILLFAVNYECAFKTPDDRKKREPASSRWSWMNFGMEWSCMSSTHGTINDILPHDHTSEWYMDASTSHTPGKQHNSRSKSSSSLDSELLEHAVSLPLESLELMALNGWIMLNLSFMIHDDRCFSSLTITGLLSIWLYMVDIFLRKQW